MHLHAAITSLSDTPYTKRTHDEHELSRVNVLNQCTDDKWLDGCRNAQSLVCPDSRHACICWWLILWSPKLDEGGCNKVEDDADDTGINDGGDLLHAAITSLSDTPYTKRTHDEHELSRVNVLNQCELNILCVKYGSRPTAKIVLAVIQSPHVTVVTNKIYRIKRTIFNDIVRSW
jgi:hypothetical protein